MPWESVVRLAASKLGWRGRRSVERRERSLDMKCGRGGSAERRQGCGPSVRWVFHNPL